MRPAGLKGEQNQAIGISRGGRSTKIHAVVDGKGRPLNFAVTGGQIHDSQVVSDVLDGPRPPLAVTADKAYDSTKVRQQIKDDGALPIIPSRCNATRKAYCPKRFYRRRPSSKLAAHIVRASIWASRDASRIVTRLETATTRADIRDTYDKYFTEVSGALPQANATKNSDAAP